MEEIEVPIDSVQEKLNETALERSSEERERWISLVALSSAIFAVFAAISSLMAGHHSNEAMLEQIQASDHWSYYQAKGIKASLLETRIELLKGMGKPVAEKLSEKLPEYKKEQEEISEKAKERETSSKHHLVIHQILARSVTLFQVAIAIAAVAVLTRRKHFWLLGLLFGAVGIGFFIEGLWFL